MKELCAFSGSRLSLRFDLGSRSKVIRERYSLNEFLREQRLRALLAATVSVSLSDPMFTKAARLCRVINQVSRRQRETEHRSGRFQAIVSIEIFEIDSQEERTLYVKLDHSSRNKMADSPLFSLYISSGVRSLLESGSWPLSAVSKSRSPIFF